ncbi:MAG: hypothetical protein KGI54_18255 [Pseudomonadota bacterium]|nr:hypothetical protein [Pseudomonadota bacterium]
MNDWARYVKANPLETIVAEEGRTAWKRVEIVVRDDWMMLQSIHSSDIVNSSPTAARCKIQHHRAPDEYCTCGWYGFYDRFHPQLVPFLSSQPLMEVYLQGKLIEHEEGVRGEWQTPLGIYLDHPNHNNGLIGVFLTSYNQQYFSVEQFINDIDIPVNVGGKWMY